MVYARIFLNPDYEVAVIRAPGRPDARRQVRDENAAAEFAREQGFDLASNDWTCLHLPRRWAGWFSAALTPCIDAPAQRVAA